MERVLTAFSNADMALEIGKTGSEVERGTFGDLWAGPGIAGIGIAGIGIVRTERAG